MEPGSEPAADRAYRLMRADILTGDLPADSRLGESTLAERYGLSRTPVREALRRLQSEGLVEVSPHRGARVFDWRRLDIEALYDLRAVVEGFLVRRAATTITDEEIDRLAGLCDRMEEVARSLPRGAPEFTDRTAEFNQEFHGSIARAAGGGELFVSIRNSVVLAPLLLRTVSGYTAEDQARTNHHHREILAAFRARSPAWAESVMLAHVHSAKSGLLAARAASQQDVMPDVQAEAASS